MSAEEAELLGRSKPELVREVLVLRGQVARLQAIAQLVPGSMDEWEHRAGNIVVNRDFSVVRGPGFEFRFKGSRQQDIVRHLWRTLPPHQGPRLSAKQLAERIGPVPDGFRITHYFRTHRAWQRGFIGRDSNGLYGLRIPPSLHLSRR